MSSRAKRKREQREPDVRLAVCIPTLSGITVPTVRTILAIFDRIESLLLTCNLPAGELPTARAMLLSDFLRSESTHLLFLDADTSCPVSTIEAMIRADGDAVLAPCWLRGERPSPSLDVVAESPSPYERHGVPLMQIMGGGLGCCLLKRGALERVVASHPELLLHVAGRPDPIPTVFTQGTMVKDGKNHLLNESISFFRRATAGGVKLEAVLGFETDHAGMRTEAGWRPTGGRP